MQLNDSIISALGDEIRGDFYFLHYTSQILDDEHLLPF